jgi:hypothetical protein
MGFITYFVKEKAVYVVINWGEREIFWISIYSCHLKARVLIIFLDQCPQAYPSRHGSDLFRSVILAERIGGSLPRLC